MIHYVLPVTRKHFFEIFLKILEVYAWKFLENLKEIVPSYYMHNSRRNSFKYTTTQQHVNRLQIVKQEFQEKMYMLLK